MYMSIEYLNDGTTQGATDWLVAGALASTVSFSRLKNFHSRYIRVTTSIQKLAQSVHKRRSAVKDSLYRLQDQNRIQIVTAPTRGNNTMHINIGMDTKGRSKTKVLFAPSLDPEYLFQMSYKNIQEAKTTKEKLRSVKYCIQHMKRTDHPQKAKWIDKLTQIQENLIDPQGPPIDP